jgi:hypothetical protein
VLKEYGGYYNHSRPQQALGQHFPVLYPSKKNEGPIQRREFWEALSTIITGIFPMKIIPMDDIFIYSRFVPH